MDATALADLDPFGIYGTEAARLDRFFAGLDEDGWRSPSRCEGWSVQDLLAHLAGEEMYNHACIDDDLAGISGDYNDFSEWCAAQRRGRQRLRCWPTGGRPTGSPGPGWPRSAETPR